MAAQPENQDAAAELKEQEPTKLNEEAEEAERERSRREREARAQALTLEIVGDLPFAEVKPPENVLFVCKLNPVTEDEDLHTIFSRFGQIVSCEVIRDKRTNESLQYAFIEYEEQKDCEQAYFKMSGVLIDDHRIHVDFSQSVSRLADVWRNKTNNKRRQHDGGFGGVAELEKRRQYRKMEAEKTREGSSNDYDMVFDKNDVSMPTHAKDRSGRNHRSRSRSPEGSSRFKRRRTPPSPENKSHERSEDRYDEPRDLDHRGQRKRDEDYRAYDQNRSRPLTDRHAWKADRYYERRQDRNSSHRHVGYDERQRRR